jgi:fibronectin-binding autotransporter adhesin
MASFQSAGENRRRKSIQSGARAISAALCPRGNSKFRYAMLGMGLLVPAAAHAQLVVNFGESSQGYSVYTSNGDYNALYYGQGAYSDSGNNVWNGFGRYGGPGSTAFYGGGRPDSNVGSTKMPAGNPGNPYAFTNGNGTASGTNLFSPTNSGASNVGNAYSNGTLSPVTLTVSTITGENGAGNMTNQGTPGFLLATADLVQGSTLGTFTLGSVPAGTYDLYLYGANYDGTRGAAFNLTSQSGAASAAGGFTTTTNPNANPNGPLTSFVLGQDYVEYLNVSPTAAGVIAGTWGAVSNPISGLSGEGDFNGLQLVEVPATVINPIYTWTGATNATFDNSSGNFNFGSGTKVAFVNGNTALFDDSATVGSHVISVTAAGVSPSLTQFNNSTSSYTFNGPGGITGTGYVVIAGGGTVTFNNANTYTGGTNITSGTLVLGSGSSLASPVISIYQGSSLNIPAGTPAGALTASNLVVSNAGTINLGGSSNLGSLNGNGVINLAGTASTLTLTGGSYSGTLNDSGSTLILAGAGGSYTGSLVDGSSANSLQVNSTGTWIVTGSNTFSGGITLTAGTLSANTSGLGQSPIQLSGGSIQAQGALTTISTKVTGGALIVANGSSGTVELANSGNTFTGPVTVQGTSGSILGGTLEIDSAGALGAATAITVGSGGSFLVNDGSGNAGRGATITLSGPGVTSTNPTPLLNGPVGALRGADNATDVWAGNVNVSGSTYIAAGANGILSLTGSITGTGPVVFTNNANQSVGALVILAPSASSANTYTGETQILPGPQSSSYGQVLQLGANNGISPNSGLSFQPGSAQIVNVDLNGYNQTVTYLTGSAETGYALTSGTVSGDNSGTVSTLTVTSGLKAGAPVYMSTAITGNIALVMNDPTGLGNQIISGANTYTGGTTITKGTLTAYNRAAFGTGSVSLNGGTLALGSTGSVSGVSAFVGTQGEGPGGTSVPTITNNVLTLTNNTTGTANAAYYPVPVPVSDKAGFTASFTYSIPAGYADGMAFVLQNDARGTAAVGDGGGDLGYGSAGSAAVTNSAAVEFNLYSFAAAGEGTAFGTNGSVPGQGNSNTFTNTSPVNLALINENGTEYLDNADAVINVTLAYNGSNQTLTETLFNTIENQTFSTTFTGVDYSALVGGPAGGNTTAYLGFVGGSGGVGAIQQISNFNYTTGVSTAPQSINSAIIATGGTTSSIQLSVAGNALSSAASVGTITINTGATLSLQTSGGSAAVRGVLQTPSVSIASNGGSFTGKFDLGFNDLDIAASGGMTIAQVTSMVASGYSNGKWTGEGIASRAAASDSTHLTALGVIVNDTTANTTGSLSGTALYSTLDGASVADGDILVKYTYYGDTNLDGKVDGTDYSRIDNGYLMKLSGWANGDFNYDGVINGSDYTLIDNAYNTQGASLNEPEAEVATNTAEIAAVTASVSAVPEPATLSLLGLAAVGMLGRRRRQM